MEAVTLPIYTTEGKEIDSVKLNSAVFDGEINTAVIYQAIVAYRANQRCGLASTKTRGEVSGGGRKPWKQKGTGRARVGSIRSPLWRKGGVVFGPHPRDFSYVLPQKIKKLALKSSLNLRLKENNIIILDNIKLEEPKTRLAAKIFSNLKLNSSVLLLADKIEPNLKKALRNISFIDVDVAKNAHAYEVMSHKKLVITKDGLKELTENFKK